MVAYTAATIPTIIAANRASLLTKNFKLALRYVGKTLLTNDLTNRDYVDVYQAKPEVAVTQLWLNTRLTSFVGDIKTTAQVNEALDQYATKKQVTDNQLGYFDKTLLGASSVGSPGAWTRIGLAKTSATGRLTKVPAVQVTDTSGQHIPAGIFIDNVAKFYDASNERVLSFSASKTVTKNNDPREFLAAEFNVPDPGYAYYPMNFVYIQGKSGAAKPELETSGTGNTGLITVYSPDTQTDYARGTCTDTWQEQSWHVALPYGGITTIPSKPPASPVKGGIKLGVYLSNHSSTNYIFYASGMTWIIVLMPVIGGN